MKNMKLGVKIGGSFGMLILAVIALGAAAVYQMKNVQKEAATLTDIYMPSMTLANNLQSELQTALFNLRKYTYTMDKPSLEEGEKRLDLAEKELKSYRDHVTRYEFLSDQAKDQETAQKALDQYKNLMEETKEVNAGIVKSRQEQEEAQKVFVESCLTFRNSQFEELMREINAEALVETLQTRVSKIITINDMIDQANNARVTSYRAQALRDAQLMAQATEVFDGITNMTELLLSTANGPQEEKMLTSVKENLIKYIQAVHNIVDGLEKVEAQDAARQPLAAAISTSVGQVTKKSIDASSKMAAYAAESLDQTSIMAMVGLGATLIFALVIATFMTLGITRPINRVIKGMTHGSEQVNEAARQVSAASQSLAEGASQQAASLEETSASLEEMASMTRQNADNANQADAMMKQTTKVVGDAAGSMHELKKAMETINQASNETSKIIKTIDEIAFQTNLLALNAAVEAARAGEAGAGFAVVADEVRNLAQRAAQAAKNTERLIAENLENIVRGTNLVDTTDQAFTQVETQAEKVGELVAEIALASQEQAQGIEQVNRAAVEMDKVCQRNSAGAEQSAAASEELNSQAGDLQNLIQDLQLLVGGGANGKKEKSEEPKGREDSRAGKQSQSTARLPMARPTQAAKPKQAALPLDDDEFFQS